jgi:diadenosine tetraphosphate (Ap4A) HIT family hydrolase
MSAVRAPHPTHVATCGVCCENAGEWPLPPFGAIWEDDFWLLRHAPPPFAIAGWVTLHAKRHVPNPADFTEEEAAAFGPVLRRVCASVRAATGCERVYVAGLGESHPHVHVHVVPRYAEDGVADGKLAGKVAAVASAATTAGAAAATPPPSASVVKGWGLFTGPGAEVAAGTRVAVREEVVRVVVDGVVKGMTQ